MREARNGNLDAIHARRNLRQYTQEPVATAGLNRIVEAGWRAPSAKDRQPWDFVVATDRALLQELSTVRMGAGQIAGAAAAIVFVILLPADDRRKVTDQHDVGQATMAMMIAANDLGIGTGHSSVGDQDKARAILGVPDDMSWKSAAGALGFRCAWVRQPGPPEMLAP